jgi:uncharacterized phage protein (TIGR01671 family)
MREIKFRAWDNKNKKMFIPSMLDWKDERDPKENDTRTFYIWRSPYEDEHVNWSHTCIGTEDSILMQYTGLDDKNGKEIYEGDVIQFKDGIVINGSNIHRSKVEWLDELSGFYIHADNVGYYQVNPSQCAMYHYEIIGNIYDNPELLEQEDAD